VVAPRAPARARSPPAPACRFPGTPWRRHALPLDPLALSLDPLPLLCSLPQHHRARSPPPLAVAMATTSPTPPGAAHELRLVPLFLLTEPPNARSPENVAGIVVFTVGHRSSSPPIRRPQGFLKHAGHPYGTAMSSRSEPLSSPPLLHRVALVSPEPIAPRRRPCRYCGYGHASLLASTSTKSGSPQELESPAG